MALGPMKCICDHEECFHVRRILGTRGMTYDQECKFPDCYCQHYDRAPGAIPPLFTREELKQRQRIIILSCKKCWMGFVFGALFGAVLTVALFIIIFKGAP